MAMMAVGLVLHPALERDNVQFHVKKCTVVTEIMLFVTGIDIKMEPLFKCAYSSKVRMRLII